MKTPTILLALSNADHDADIQRFTGIEISDIIVVSKFPECEDVLKNNHVDYLLIDESLVDDPAKLELLITPVRPELVLIFCEADTANKWETFIPVLLDDYFEKPVNDTKLLRYLRKHIAFSNNQWHEFLFDNLDDAAFLADADTGIIVEVNRMGEVLLGKPRSEIIGLDQSQIHPDHLSGQAKHIFKEYSTSIASEPVQIKIERSDGETIPTEISAKQVSLYGQDYILGIFHDITERNLHLESSKRLSKWYETIFNAMPYGGQVLSLDGTIEEVSARSCALLGYSKAELIGKHFTSLLPTEHKKQFAAYLSIVLKQESVKADILLRHKNGNLIPVLRSARLISSDVESFPDRILAIDLEVSDLREAQEALVHSENSFRSFIEQAHDAIMMVNESGIITAWNKQGEIITGRASAEYIGKPLWEFQATFLPENQRTPEAIAKLKQIILGVLHTGESIWPSDKHELKIQHLDGSIRTIEQTIRVIKTNKGYQLSTVSLDISELVEARERSDKNLRLLNDAQDVAKIGSLFYDFKLDQWISTEAIHSILGLPESYERCMDSWVALIGENHEAVFTNFMDELRLSDKTEFEIKYQMVRFSDQALIWVKHSGRCAKDEQGVNINFTSTVQDITEPKLQSESLRRSEQRLKNSQYLARLGTFTADPMADTLTANMIFAEIVGLDNAVPLKYSDWQRIIHPGDKERLSQKLEHREGDRNTLNNEDFRIIRETDGEVRWVNGLTEYTYNSNHELVKISGTIQDITERISAQKKIEESEQVLLRSQEVGQIGSYVLDIEKDTWTSTPILDRIFGIESSYIKNTESWLAVVHDDDRQTMAQYFVEKILGERKPFDKSYRIQRKNDKAVRWVHGLGSLEFDDLENPIRMYGTIQDITQQKESESELRKLSFALEQSPASIVITDLEGTIEYANAKFVDITGYSLDEAIGKNPRILKADVACDTDYKHLWDTILSGGIWQGEFHNKKKSGELYWEWAVISPIRDESGEISQLLAVKEDITQRKLDEAKQQSLQDQLNRAQRMEAIGTLAGGIAHDFNNILQSMFLYLGMAKDALPDGYVKDDIKQVSKAADRAKELVGQILTYSRQGEVKKSNVLIQYVIKEGIKFLKSSLPVSVKFKEEINTDCLAVYCDPTHIHQIFMNIGTNAFDALPNQMGTISVTLDMIEVDGNKDSKVNVPLGKYVELQVSDTGSGIPQGVMPLIFNPFFSTKEPGKGSGLGLSVAMGIMEELGGKIYAESEDGVGTTFRLLFPAIGKEETVPDHGITEGVDFASLSIIIIDFEEEVRKGIQRTLENLDCHIVSCESALDVLEMLNRYPGTFSLVLADDNLMTTTGFALAKEVKQEYPDLSFILMSGRENVEEDYFDELKYVDAILHKPWHVTNLLSTISGVLQNLDRELETDTEKESYEKI